jgi:carbon monoxide dehydrogenase subunit G
MNVPGPGQRAQSRVRVVRWENLGVCASRCSNWLTRLAAVLIVLAAADAAGADQLSVEAHREGEAVIVEARASLHVELAMAWEVLTGYDRYAQFIPDLTSSRVLSRSGGDVVVEQKGQVGFLVFRLPMEVTMSVSERPRTGISSRAIGGTFREMTGSYTLEQAGDDLQLTYSGRIVPRFGLLSLMGTAAVKAAVEKQFGALVREMKSRAAVPEK